MIMIECREIVDSVQAQESPPQPRQDQCRECDDLQRQFAENPGGKPVRRKGLIIAAIAGGSAIALSAICLPFVTPALRRVCLPYVPATTAQVDNIIKALQIHGKPKSLLVDIGSGDGRVVHAATKHGFKAHGIELNPWLVLYSKIQSRRLGVSGLASFSRQDLWKSNFKDYDNVVIFGVEQMMADLEQKLEQEVKKDCTVIACRFPFPNWQQTSILGEGIDSVWIYKPKVS